MAERQVKFTCEKCGDTYKRPTRLSPLICPVCMARCCEKCMPCGVWTPCVDCEEANRG